jgi:aminopeptidase N
MAWLPVQMNTLLDPSAPGLTRSARAGRVRIEIMFAHNLTRDEVAHRSDLISTRSYQVSVDLTGHDGSGRQLDDPEHTFVSTSVARFEAARAEPTHIDLIADRVLAASLNGQDLDPAAFADSRLGFTPTTGENELEITALCRYSRTGEGLHRFTDPADGRQYLYTQFEASEARRVYACFEQPDLKATFELSVLAPAQWIVIGNSVADPPAAVDAGAMSTTATPPNAGTEPAAADAAPAGPYQRWHFPATPPMSTYLTSFVAGEYAQVTDSHQIKNGILPISILVRQSLADHLDYERIFATTKSGFDIFEKHFGYPYPFGKYDQAFVPEYNMGAMENIACVTLRDELVFRSRVTAASYRSRDETILHELAHMWFGDLVTMVWWDDMWLKESFAEWAATFAVSELVDDPHDAWAAFTGSRKNWAYRQDQLPTTHPIVADMVDLEAVESNFDGITYAKGASVLRQLVAFVGQDAFLAGVRDYFDRHAFGNTRLNDLLSAVAATSGRDLSGWSAEWLETSGVNTMAPRFDVDAAGKFTRFAIEQTAPADWPTLRHHRLAVGLYRLRDGALVRTDRVELDVAGQVTEVTELVGLARPDLILLNDDDLSYAKIRFDQRSLQTLTDHLGALDSALARALAWGAAWDMCRDAELPATEYADLVLGNVGAETDLQTVRAVLGNGGLAVESYTAPADRPAVLQRWEDGLATELGKAADGSDHQLALTQAYARSVNSAEGRRRLQDWLSGDRIPAGLEVDAELRWLLTGQLARLGIADAAMIDAEQQRDNTATGAQSAAAARTARPTAEAKQAAWAAAVDGNEIPNETQRRICVSFWQPRQQAALAGFTDRYLAAAEEISTSEGIWAQKSSALRQNVLQYLFPAIADEGAELQRVQQWLDGGRTRTGAPLGDMVKHLAAERLDGQQRAHRCQLAAQRDPRAAQAG